MNLIILAAGSGKRLYPLTKDRPKSLLDIGDGSTLLDRQIQAAIESESVTRVYIVVGYLQEMIDQAMAPYRDQIEIELIYNPYFDVSNAMLSLWCAHYVLEEDDFFISNGDNIYRVNLFDQMSSGSREGIKLAVSFKREYDDDDMKVVLGDDRAVLRVSKTISSTEAAADSVGLLMVKGSRQRAEFRQALLDAAKDREYFNAFWQQVFDFVVARGQSIQAHEVSHSDWAEIDFHPDVELMRSALFANLPPVEQN